MIRLTFASLCILHRVIRLLRTLRIMVSLELKLRLQEQHVRLVVMIFGRNVNEMISMTAKRSSRGRNALTCRRV